MENDTQAEPRRRGPKPASPPVPSWLGDRQAVDTAVAAMLDSADRQETAAAAVGASRLMASSVRGLRHHARQLAEACGTPHALDAPPEPEAPSAPVLRHPSGEQAAS